MPKIDVNGVSYAYDDVGEGPETVVFAHGLLLDRSLWEPQVAALSDRYRCITFDFRGHGETASPRTGYDMDTLAADAVDLIDALDAAPCHFAGLSMGGFVALRLGFGRPELLRSLLLLDTSAEPEPEANRPRYKLLQWVARIFGLRVVAGRVLPIMFGESTLEDPEKQQLLARWKRIIGGHGRRVLKAVDGVLDRDGVVEEVRRITVPTLIVVGEEDVATVPARAERLHGLIDGSRLERIPRAGHLSNIEQPEAVNRVIGDFLAGVEG